MINIVKRRLKMPDPLEFPRMLCAVVPLMRPGDSVVNEFVALAFWHASLALQLFRTTSRRYPAFAAVIRALNDLPEPTARLRSVNRSEERRVGKECRSRW